MRICSFVFSITIAGLACKAKCEVFHDSFNKYARIEPVTDSLLLRLQQENEVVLAFAEENYARGETKEYYIITLNKGQWKGYYYYKQIHGVAKKEIETIIISNETCNETWKFMQVNEVWKIKGSNGKKDPCKNVAMHDGVIWRLLILTKDKISDPAYYEPVIYERNCPGNEERRLFIETVNKIKNAVSLKRR